MPNAGLLLCAGLIFILFTMCKLHFDSTEYGVNFFKQFAVVMNALDNRGIVFTFWLG